MTYLIWLVQCGIWNAYMMQSMAKCVSKESLMHGKLKAKTFHPFLVVTSFSKQHRNNYFHLKHIPIHMFLWNMYICTDIYYIYISWSKISLTFCCLSIEVINFLFSLPISQSSSGLFNTYWTPKMSNVSSQGVCCTWRFLSQAICYV